LLTLLIGIASPQSASQSADPAQSSARTETRVKVILIDDSVIKGSLIGIKDGQLTITSAVGTVNIELSKLRRIEFEGNANDPAPVPRGEADNDDLSLRPEILHQEKARYTKEARKNGVEGTVLLSVIFRADGKIEIVGVIEGLPDGLTESAKEAAQKVRFKPAMKNGKPVSINGKMEFTFELNDR
jgi:TonB family protein